MQAGGAGGLWDKAEAEEQALLWEDTDQTLVAPKGFSCPSMW